MQDINLVCTLDGAEYKEYEVLMNEQSLGVISWKSEVTHHRVVGIQPLVMVTLATFKHKKK
jgi:hypothetical protein